MNKRAPKKSQLALMILFAFSCFAILLYLWTTFGGPTPLTAQAVPDPRRLRRRRRSCPTPPTCGSPASPSGACARRELHGDRTRVTIEIKPEYAPLPTDTQAILRLKTLLGETYIELTPGAKQSKPLPDGGQLPTSQIAETVELDEILRAFDAETREGDAAVPQGRGRRDGRACDRHQRRRSGTCSRSRSRRPTCCPSLDSPVGASCGSSPPTRGTVFDALGAAAGRAAGADHVRATACSPRPRAATRTWPRPCAILPTTLRELRPTLADLDGLVDDATPVVRDLRPAARALGPTLEDAVALAPELEGLFRDVDRVIDVADSALPATTEFVDSAVPLFKILTPTLQEAKPVVDFLGPHKREFTQMWANIASATQGTRGRRRTASGCTTCARSCRSRTRAS